MGIILSRLRKEKSTQEVLEALQEKIDALEAFTVNTQVQKKRIVGNFLAVSIGVYVIAFVVFYFVYFPPTWQERIVYFVPLLLFPIVIILLRYLFTWYFQRKLNKNSKKLTALRAEKKKILEEVMDKETYKVAVNLLARFADKPNKTTFALAATTPSKPNQPLLSRNQPLSNQSMLNRSLPAKAINPTSTQLSLTTTPTLRSSNTTLSGSTPRLTAQFGTPATPSSTALMAHTSGQNQQLRRRTPFPIVNQQNKGVFDRIVDVLIGDGPQDRFAMICKECYSHNGMALKEDFEYTTFKCAFCNALNPARKSRPVAPRLSVLPPPTSPGSDTSDSEDDKDDSDNEPTANMTNYSTPTNINTGNNENNEEHENNDGVAPSTSTPSSDEDDKEQPMQDLAPQSDEANEENQESTKLQQHNKSLDELLQQLEKSDSAIEDTTTCSE